MEIGGCEIPESIIEAVTALADQNADDMIAHYRASGLGLGGADGNRANDDWSFSSALAFASRAWWGRANAIGLFGIAPFDPVNHTAVRAAADQGDVGLFNGFSPDDVAAAALALDTVAYMVNLAAGKAMPASGYRQKIGNLALAPLFPIIDPAGLSTARGLMPAASEPKKHSRNHRGPVDLTQTLLTEREAAAVLRCSRQELAERRLDGAIPDSLYRQKGKGCNVSYVTKKLLEWIDQPGNFVTSPRRKRRR